MTDFSHIAADRMDKALFAALWSALDQQPFSAVSLEQLVDEFVIFAKHTPYPTLPTKHIKLLP